MRREPAVAGQFYPGNKQELESQLQKFCRSNESPFQHVSGIISPHAGYIYSGGIAGRLFSRLEIPDRVILLGPNHHGAGHPGAVYSSGSWRTPLGEIRVDTELADRILAACPHFAADDVAHRQEHSLEVQVPFIQYCNPEATFVPICIGHLPLENLIASGESLADVIAASGAPVLIIASSDMTHFESADAARKKDFLALEHVENIDPEGLYATVRDHRISMCGVLPSVVMLAAVRKLGAQKGELVEYGHSGDITGDDRDVVGYAAAVVQ